MTNLDESFLKTRLRLLELSKMHFGHRKAAQQHRGAAVLVNELLVDVHRLLVLGSTLIRAADGVRDISL